MLKKNRKQKFKKKKKSSSQNAIFADFGTSSQVKKFKHSCQGNQVLNYENTKFAIESVGK